MFLVNELKLDQLHAMGLNIEVKRASGPAGKTTDPGRNMAVKDEVLVRFETSIKRDDVQSFAKNLERKG